MQKYFQEDFPSKKCHKNDGQLPKYYASEDHEAIIAPVIFDYVQSLREGLHRYVHTKGRRLTSKLVVCVFDMHRGGDRKVSAKLTAALRKSRWGMNPLLDCPPGSAFANFT